MGRLAARKEAVNCVNRVWPRAAAPKPGHQCIHGPLVKLVWFSRHEPELAGQVRWWVGLKDYVLHHLTGELVTELSSASGTGLLNLKSRNWDAQSLELAGIVPTSCHQCCQLPRCAS